MSTQPTTLADRAKRRSIVSRMAGGCCRRLVLIAMYVLLFPAAILSQSGPSSPSNQVHGEVLMLTSELVVVKLPDGTSILLHLGKDAIVESSLKVADRVEVRFTSDHHVISVKKLSVDTEPRP